MSYILLVEDNEMNRDMLMRRLRRRGFEVDTAADGAQAIDQVEARPPELILMDLSLPVMDGWEATRRLKASPATADIPVVALTAHALKEDEKKAFAAGCDAFETKPVNLGRLISTILELLQKSA